MFSQPRRSTRNPYQNQNFLNLAAAYLAIETYMKKATAAEKPYLMQLMNRIRAIETAQRGWLTAEQKLLHEKKHQTQSEVLQQEAEAQKKKIGFTKITVEKLNQDVLKQLNAQGLSDGIFHLLNFVNKCASAVLSTLEKNIARDAAAKPHEVSVVMDEGDNRFYLGDTAVYSYTTQLGGRGITANQSYDPLRGKDKRGDQEMEFGGTCYGHVMSWVKQVEMHGKDTTAISLDTETLRHQLDQNPNLKTSARYQSSTEIHAVVDKITSQINNTNRIYGISIVSYSSTSHFTGVRIIPETHEVEMTDNDTDKVIIFPTMDHYAVWLKSQLTTFYVDRGGGALILYDIGKQPPNATPSLPPLEPKRFSFGAEDAKKFVDAHQQSFAAISNDPSQAAEFIALFHRKFELRSHLMTQSNSAELQGIDAQFTKFQLKRFEHVTGKPLDEKALRAYKKSFMQQHKHLQTKAINKIDEQIKNIGSGHEEIKTALMDLKKRIRNAPPSLSLSAIVDDWLLTKTKNGATNRTLLQQHSKTFNFIGDFVKNHEVSPIGLSLIQEMLIHKVLAITQQRDWSRAAPNGLPHAYQQLQKKFSNTTDFRRLLTEMRQLGRANAGNWFWQQWNKQSDALSNLNHALKNIDLDNPHALLKAYNELERLDKRAFNKMSVAIDHAPTARELKK